MDRRAFLGVAAASTAAVSGCLHERLVEGEDRDAVPDHERPVQEFIAGMDEGDAERVNAAIHPDGEVTPLSEEDAEEFGRAGWSVGDVEIVDERENMMVVRAPVTVTAPGGVRSRTETTEWELRRTDGEWLIWDGGPGRP